MPQDAMSLERRISQLKKQVQLLTWLSIGAISIVVFLNIPWRVRADGAQDLKVRRLEVVDEKGVARVIIAAPLPEPIVNGKRTKRDTPMSGILIYDPKGNERGGYGTSDAADLSALLTLDSENSQVFTAYANGGSSGATVWVSNENNQNVIMSSHHTALFEVTRGKTVIFKQPPDAPDLKQ